MFPYFGSKQNLVDYYPPPSCDKIIEPFAGSARYALTYWERDVTLIDRSDMIIGIWRYLKQATVHDILAMKKIQNEHDYLNSGLISKEERDLLGFVLSRMTSAHPKRCVSKISMAERPNKINYRLNFIAKNLDKVRHWNLIEGDYTDAPNCKATWFVDPPYQLQGKHYKFKKVDYGELAAWCYGRSGQVIVCEQLGADWMPFKHLAIQRGSRKTTTDVMYTNQPFYHQQRLFQ